ncbi:phytochrome-like protein cph2 [mine drainage metagenome]|uniref:Phytochrome-like protein cph2 n=1 Tax=mine drainage metagenome TaxID=410659 RepID=A0A1J5TND3_9ZZZZ
MTTFFRLLFLLAGLASVLQGSTLAYSAETVKIGVLAYRSKAQTQAQWQPLAKALKQAIPEYDFEMEALTIPELEASVLSRQLDFVLTNSAHYIRLNHAGGLSAPLATLASSEDGQRISVYGGVIFSRAAEANLNTLTDIKNRTIAVVNVNSFGGYQMQMYALKQAGVNLRRDNKLLITTMPQDKVVDAVLAGRADVGFVRSGVLEAMAHEGKLDMKQIKVINLQNLPDFPVKVSTRLYPEWAFSSMPNVDERLARHVVATLFTLEENKAATGTMGIHGFVVPADYTPVVELLKELRVSPFDKSPVFTWQDILVRYHWQALFSLLAIGLILFQSVRLLLTKLALQSSHSVLQEQQKKLQESEFRWKFAIEGSGDGMWDWNVETDEAHFSKRWKEMLGYAEEDILPCNEEWTSRIHPDDRAYVDETIKTYLAGKSDIYLVEYRRQCKDDSYKWILSRGMAVEHSADGKPLRVIGTHIDITERKLAEEALQLYANVFTHAREGIIIANADGNIVDVNEALTSISGYSREELLGRNPSDLSSGRQDNEFYAAMWMTLKKNGHWSGEVWNRRKNGEVYAEMKTISAVHDAHGNVKNYVALCSDITLLKEHAQQLEHIAHYDALTSLPNRVLLADRLSQAMTQAQRRGCLLAVAFLDLDGFKAINDNYGHDVGDQLLVAVASRMKQTLRDGDTLSRIGGDEFVAILLDLADVEASIPMLSRMLAAAAEPIEVNGDLLQVTASLGVTFYPQVEEIDADQLQRQADQAMYQAKQAGKNRYYIFDAEQDSSVRSLHESLDRIRRALVEREFMLYYQPKVNLRTGAIIGAEALIRWQHPDKGILLPASFLPVIEDHALAIDIGEWVIDAALAQIEIWHAAGLDIPVSVNVGARQLQQPDFVERLRETLASHPDVAPTSLEVELLETSALEDMTQVSHTINRCREMGVKFALDDFGTGYSSLSYLKRLPVHILKIDQSFVRDMLNDPDDLAILEGVIGLATAFQRQVIAEGVETLEHGTVLLQLGCELAQGYGIARPMPANELPDWASKWRPDAAWSSQPVLSRSDLPVLFASAEHRVWTKAVEHYLKDEREWPPILAYQECHFGRWLEGVGRMGHGTQPAFTLVNALHEQAHTLAEALCALKMKGLHAAALEGIPELNSLRDALLLELNVLLQQHE